MEPFCAKKTPRSFYRVLVLVVPNGRFPLHLLLLLFGLIISSVAQATPNFDSLKASLTGQWCPNEGKLHFVLLFGYGLEKAQGPGAVDPEVWPLGFIGFFGLAGFGQGGTSCTVKTCPEHPVFDSAIRPPAWKIQRSLDTASLPGEVTISIPAFATDPSFGPDSFWHFQLQSSEVKNHQGCHSLNGLWGPTKMPSRAPSQSH